MIRNNNEIQQIKRSLHFRNTSFIWNLYHFNSTKNVGKCSSAAQTYYENCKTSGKSPNIEDYEQFYFTNIITQEDFRENSKKFCKKLKESGILITYEQAYLYQWIRVIYDSFNGIVKNEYEIIKKLQNNENYIEHTDENTDRRYSIDALSLNNYGFFIGIQIKPLSFLNGLKAGKADIVTDFYTAVNNQNNWLKQDGNKNVIWVFYKEGKDLEIYDLDEMKGNYYDCTN